jgi:uncharacterized protein YndB with AHSA1/START domain
MATQTKTDTDLVITRIFDARRELVWKTWTESERIKRWWGPQYFTSPVAKIDLRVGGSYLYAMRGPDGRDYWSTGTFREVIPQKKIVATDAFADEKGSIVPATHYGLSADFPKELLLTVTFEDVGEGKTKVTLRHAGIPAGEGMDNTRAGWSTSLDKLAEALK